MLRMSCSPRAVRALKLVWFMAAKLVGLKATARRETRSASRVGRQGFGVVAWRPVYDGCRASRCSGSGVSTSIRGCPATMSFMEIVVEIHVPLREAAGTAEGS